MEKNKDRIEELIKSLGGHIETGKEVMISANPPDHDTKTVNFESTIKGKLAEAGIDVNQFDIAHSSTAVDIGPIGSNKLAALRQFLGENHAIYFGDAQNDQQAMEGSVVGAVPGNSAEEIKHVARESVFGLISEKPDLEGTVEGLKEIEKFWRLHKIKAIKESEA